jgi:hypothetical protein
MESRLMHILAGIAKEYRAINRMMQLPSVGKPRTNRTSNKSKLKQTKSKPNIKYKSSKPISSKVTKTFRNKSNI